MNKLPFEKKNYQLMIVGFLIIALGFTIMASDSQQFGWLGLTLGPIVIVGGFITEVFAILYTPKVNKE